MNREKNSRFTKFEKEDKGLAQVKLKGSFGEEVLDKDRAAGNFFFFLSVFCFRILNHKSFTREKCAVKVTVPTSKAN